MLGRCPDQGLIVDRSRGRSIVEEERQATGWAVDENLEASTIAQPDLQLSADQHREKLTLEIVSPMNLPKPSEQAKAAFLKLVTRDPAVTTRPMFGNISAFLNGNMFCGLFGDDLFVRVSDGEQAEIRKQGGKLFEVMPGRAMTGYVLLPPGWQKKDDVTRGWIMEARDFAKKLPPKAAKAKAAKGKPAVAASRRTR